MAIHVEEFERVVTAELTSDDPHVKRLAIKRLYVLMTGAPALDDDAAQDRVKELCDAILAALA
jgi:hypothetical protein